MDDAYQKGNQVRRAVLGDEAVDRMTANVDEFGRPLQDLITEYCWGSVWARPGLERPFRSLLTIAMLAVLNRPDELRAHVAAARRNGCTVEQIREVLLQAAVYGGIPCGVASLRIAREALAADLESA